MSDIANSEVCAKNLVKNLISYLPTSSSDITDAYEAGEYIAAAHGAIHDLGILRADIPEQFLLDIEKLLMYIKTEDDTFNLKFLASMEIGYSQLKERWVLVKSNQSA